MRSFSTVSACPLRCVPPGLTTGWSPQPPPNGRVCGHDLTGRADRVDDMTTEDRQDVDWPAQASTRVRLALADPSATAARRLTDHRGEPPRRLDRPSSDGGRDYRLRHLAPHDVAWQLAHVIVGRFGARSASHFGGPPVDYDTFLRGERRRGARPARRGVCAVARRCPRLAGRREHGRAGRTRRREMGGPSARRPRPPHQPRGHPPRRACRRPA